MLAPLAVIGVLLAKFKGLALLLLKVKFVGTALTMLVSIGAYALLFPGVVRGGDSGPDLGPRDGTRPAAEARGHPGFGPDVHPVSRGFRGDEADAEGRSGRGAGRARRTRARHARRARHASGCTPLTREPLFLGLAYFNFIINLFNLAPLLPLDGGRAVGAMSPVFQVVGLVVMVALFFVAPIMALVALLGLPELWHRWRTRNTPEGQAYYDIPLRNRVAVGARVRRA